MKRLFDVFIHEVIFDGERFLIVMKTTDESLDPEERQKEKATRKKFELLRFGEPTVNYPNTTTLIINGFAFIMRIDVAKTK